MKTLIILSLLLMVVVLFVAGCDSDNFQDNPVSNQNITESTQSHGTYFKKGGNGRIAFVSRRDGGYEIYVMNSDGTGLTNLTRNEASDYSPDWSPNGKQIVFVSDRGGNDDIYTMNSDGTRLTRLTYSGYNTTPSWSPNGKQIAFSSYRDGNYEIYVMNSDGTGLTNLTKNEASDDSPDWSSNGKQIVFYSDRDGDYDIYVMNADGSGVTQLTYDFHASDPAWSSNDNRIAFVGRPIDDENYDIYVMNADGSGITRLTNFQGYDFSPSWSRDSKQIAFSSEREGFSDIYIMNADGTGITNVTQNHSSLDGSPAWGK